jgi:zinc protease
VSGPAEGDLAAAPQQRARRAAAVAVSAGVALLLAVTCAHQPGEPPAPAAGGAGGRWVPAPAVVAGSPGSASAAAALAEKIDATYWQGRSDLIRPPPPPQPAPLPLPRLERWRLANGLDVVTVPRAEPSIVSFTFAIRAGAYDEDRDKTFGVAQFTAAMLRKGTRKRSAEQISEAIDFVGGSLDAASGAESTTVACTALAKDQRLCLDLLAESLLAPTFPAGEMEEVRDQVLAALAARYDDPHQLAAEHLDNQLFGEAHPDGWVLTPERVKAIDREALVAFWRTYYRPANAMLAIAGDVDAAAVKAAVTRAFGGWEPAPVPPRAVPAIPQHRGTRVLLVDKPDLSQATLMFGHRGLKHTDPDWYATTLVNYVLGGSDFSSRLMIEVRANRGLTYGIGSSFGATLYQGAFRVYAATRNETALAALEVAIAEVRKMKRDGPTALELDKAKGYYAGSTPFGLQSAAGIARAIVAAEMHGLGIGYVRDLPLRLAAVEVPAARAAADARLHPDDLVVVMVGKGAAVEPQLAKARLPFERIDFRAPISAAARAGAASQ